MAKFLASSQSEHGWRALLYGFSLNGWNVLGPDLPGLLAKYMYTVHMNMFNTTKFVKIQNFDIKAHQCIQKSSY